VLVPSNKGAWPEVRDQLNRLLRGWSNYFGYGTRLQAYRAVDNHVYDHVRHFLAKRHKVQSRGSRHFPRELVERFQDSNHMGMARNAAAIGANTTAAYDRFHGIPRLATC